MYTSLAATISCWSLLIVLALAKNRSIFGLRKTSKISFPFNFMRTVPEQQIRSTFLYDCKDTSIRSLHWTGLLRQICEDVCKKHGIKARLPSDQRLLSGRLAQILMLIKKQRKIILIFDISSLLDRSQLTMHTCTMNLCRFGNRFGLRRALEGTCGSSWRVSTQGHANGIASAECKTHSLQ